MKIDKNKLDDLFRKGLDQQEEDFQEAHWLALEKRLEAEEGKKPLVLFSHKWIGIAAAMLFLTVAAIWTYEINKRDIAQTQVKVTKDKAPKNLAQQLPEKNNNIDRLEKAKTQAQNSFNAKVEGGYPEMARQENIIRIAKPPISLMKDTSHLTEVSKNIVESRNRSLSIAIKEIKPMGIYALALADIKTTREKLSGNSEKIAEKTDNFESDKQGKNTGLVLAIVAAPDITSVRGTNTTSKSKNLGLTISKPISQRITVSAGLMYSWKNYSSPYNFYNPKHKPMLQTYPNDVDATCRILDIPLAINFSIFKSTREEIKLGMGTSSYIMLNEKYDFNYDNMPSMRYELKGENRHLFGTADLSVSYERKLKSLIVGIKPYYQIPLKGIGYGRTSLESKGVALSLGLNIGKAPNSNPN